MLVCGVVNLGGRDVMFVIDLCCLQFYFIDCDILLNLYGYVLLNTYVS